MANETGSKSAIFVEVLQKLIDEGKVEELRVVLKGNSADCLSKVAEGLDIKDLTIITQSGY